jgi:Cu-Zn family superoxide dismutase
MRVRYPLAAATVGLFVGTLACAPPEEAQEEAQPQEQGTIHTHAVAVLVPTEGSDVRGVVTFSQIDIGVRVVADLVGLEPGPHGFHIHQYGDCSASDGTSAGGHFNPEGIEHGAPTDEYRHVGDLGNVMVDEAGTSHYEFIDDRMTFAGPTSIVGRGMIVHAGEDDLGTQPTGDAGGRVACGVIGIARP